MGDAIFRFFFKYPPVAFERGRIALASGWPAWVLLLLMILVVAAVGHYLWRWRAKLPVKTRAVVWGLQSAVLAILLLLLWRPSLIVSSQVPQQNVVAVLVDDSSSMAMADDGGKRVDQVRETFADNGPLLAQLRQKFQVRLYRFSKDTAKIPSVSNLTATADSTHLQESLSQVYGELRHLSLAGMVVVSDGAENGSLASREMLDDLRARKIPVFALGVGNPEFDRDVQIDDVTMPGAALPGSVIAAGVTIRHRGYLGDKARLQVRDGGEVLKSREISFGPSEVQTIPLNFVPKTKGLREYTVSISPLEGEAVKENNSRSRLVEVQDRTAKILYLEGEPRYEYKYIRRALDDDKNLRLVSLLKTSESKFYKQGVENPDELGETLPERKKLFQYEGLIIGSINASFFSAQQQEDIYEFVSRRGGGVLFLGGRYALSDGGYQGTSLTALLPVQLGKPSGTPSLRRVAARFQLTPRGFEELQLSEDEALNRKSWEELPPLGNYQVTGEPKPGAVVLADAIAPDGKPYPVLVAQRFGRGRALLFATDGSWRWRMQLESTNRSPETFWRQILHSLVNESPSAVTITSDKPLYLGEDHVRLQARVYDEDFQSVNGAAVVATIYSPDGNSHDIPLRLSPEGAGAFLGEWQAASPGVYRVEAASRVGDKEIGKGASYFQRADGSLESFSAEQNVPFLTRLAEQSGGKYFPLEKASALPEQLTYSPAGVSVPEVRDLWDMPIVLFFLLILKGTEWVLRKRWRSI